MNKILVAGTGITKFGELWSKSLRQLALEASLLALKDAGLSPDDIDGVYVANMIAPTTSGQSHLGPLVTGELGINVQAVHIEAACASGGTAIQLAAESIKSGQNKTVLVVGVEKMTDLSTPDITAALMQASDDEVESFYGANFAGLYALMATVYMDKYGLTQKDLATIAVKNHHNARLNPNAHFHNSITVDDVLNSAPVASPLKLFDCSPISDGAAAVILTSETNVVKNKVKVSVLASSSATDSLSLCNRQDLTSLKSARLAAKNAYQQANIKPKDINVAEVHDCFTIAEVFAMEDLGFYEKGMAFKGIRNAETTLSGKLPINTSGGLKGCGHPVGATGIKQVIEIVHQLEGTAGDRQIPNVRYGLTHNVGGSGSTCVVSIFGI
ncbi:thiolase domain-containing protein [Candidatus Woesebacteria bacterium]|nr:MAG: thiolase domain-containing protein [Candidatus Woesebacteria bacterium]